MATENEKRACKRKKRFPNDVSVQAALKRINPGKAHGSRPARVYKCPVCGGFHLTSQSPR